MCRGNQDDPKVDPQSLLQGNSDSGRERLR